jgi:uridylate kinase
MHIPSGQRISLKISGEFLSGASKTKHGICWETLDDICQTLAQLNAYQWVVILGGGNFFRGTQGALKCGQGIADAMGMMATHLNGLALVSGLIQGGVQASLMTARHVEGVGQTFDVVKAEELLQKGSVVVCTGGLGHGAMTTDTAAVVRACELGCSWILKGTSVDGIYDKDPKKYPSAQFYPHISYDQAIGEQLEVVDMTALILAKTYGKNMAIFSLNNPKGLGGLIEHHLDGSRVDCSGPM